MPDRLLCAMAFANSKLLASVTKPLNTQIRLTGANFVFKPGWKRTLHTFNSRAKRLLDSQRAQGIQQYKHIHTFE